MGICWDNLSQELNIDQNKEEVNTYIEGKYIFIFAKNM